MKEAINAAPTPANAAVRMGHCNENKRSAIRKLVQAAAPANSAHPNIRSHRLSQSRRWAANT